MRALITLVLIVLTIYVMTAKPFLYVFNLDEDELTDDALRAELAALVAPAEAEGPASDKV